MKWGNSDQSHHKFANHDHEYMNKDTAKEKNVETDD